jgi:hypothetical protein
VAIARRSLREWATFYNDERSHQSLQYRTPREIFEGAASEHGNCTIKSSNGHQ